MNVCSYLDLYFLNLNNVLLKYASNHQHFLLTIVTYDLYFYLFFEFPMCKV